MTALEAFLGDCREHLGGRGVVTDADVIAGHAADWTGRWHGDSPALLRPQSTAHVAAIVAAARRHRVSLVPQGGRTGLVGGAVPLGGEVLVDLRGLDELGPVDAVAAQVTVGAGVPLAAVQAHVRPHGLTVGVDLAARDSATIGGMVATNAGGLHVLRHGTMRQQVVGLEAVLGTGATVSANPAGLVKDNTGYDLVGLLCGSEGTLGIVTQVRLRLVTRPSTAVVALLGFGSLADAVQAAPTLRAAPSLQALEVVQAAGIELVASHLGANVPLAPVPPVVVLAELAGEGDLLDELAGVLDRLGPAVVASAVADDPVGMAALWRWREAHTEAAASLGVVHKADVTVPLTSIVSFVGQVAATVAAAVPSATTFVFGHLGDGNLHVNVVGPAPDDERAIDAVLELVLAHGGSVSAEHGIGIAKRRWLERQRGSAAVGAMRAIKHALDPDGILNPGVLLP